MIEVGVSMSRGNNKPIRWIRGAGVLIFATAHAATYLLGGADPMCENGSDEMGAFCDTASRLDLLPSIVAEAIPARYAASVFVSDGDVYAVGWEEGTNVIWKNGVSQPLEYGDHKTGSEGNASDPRN